MSTVAMLWRSQLRRRWRSWVLLTLLLALGAGAGMACVAGARRAASAFDRFASAGEFPDVNSGHSRPPADAEATIAGFDGVESHGTVVGFVGFVEDLDPTAIKYFIASWETPLARLQPTLRAGRFPHADRVDEVMVVGEGARAAGLQPGDELTVQFFTTDFSRMVAHDVEVVGVGDDPLAAVADATYDRTGMYFTPAFARANAADQQAWSASELIAEPGEGNEAALISQVTAVGWSIDETRPTTQTRVQDAIRPLVTVLALLGLLVLATTLLVVGQAMARRSDAASAEREAIRAMGTTRQHLRSLDLLSVLTVAIPGAILALVVAVAASRLFPTGAVGRLDPASGAFTDWTVLVLGAVCTIATLLVLGTPRQQRTTSRDAARPLLSWLTSARPQMAPGVRLAVGGTTRQRREFWRSLALTAGGLCLLVGGVAFVASLGRLKDEPARFGAGWDLTTRNAFGDVHPDDVRTLTAGDSDIEGLTGATLNTVVVEGRMTVPVMAFLPITAELWPTVTDGDVPRRDDEVLVGADVLAALDVDIGDRIRLDSASGTTSPAPGGDPASSEAATVTIVGTAVFPSIELAGVDPTRLGRGIAMGWDGYQALIGLRGLNDAAPDLVFFDLADGVEAATVIDRYPEGMPESSCGAPTEWLTSLAPAEVIETDRATGLIWLVVGLLAVIVAASCIHTLIGSVREHRRDYATLKAIGFTRRQVLGSVTWQALTPIVLALAFALPVGTALGRWCWRLLAQMIGVIDTSVVPVTSLLVVAVAALVAVGLVAVGPGLRAAHSPAAALLHDE